MKKTILCNNCISEIERNALDLIKRQQSENERLQTEKDNLIKTFAECQKDVIKEFAERLKKDFFNTEHHIDRYYRKSIDNLVKEMVGEDL